MTTTGSSAIKAVNVLREAGYIVNRVIAIVDRQENHKVWDNNEINSISLLSHTLWSSCLSTIVTTRFTI